MMECFVEVCGRKGLKFNANKSKLIVLDGEDAECEIHVDGAQLEQVSEFKYWGCVLDKSGTEVAEWEESSRCYQ